MATRREVLSGIVGVSAVSLLPATSFAVPVSTVQSVAPACITSTDAALNLIVEKIRQSFASFVMFEETSCIPAEWGKFFAIWEDYAVLRTMVQDDLGAVFSHPDFRRIKRQRGSIKNAEGRMNYHLQVLLAEHFPVLPDRSDEALFEAYLVHAPKSLL